MEGAFVLDSKTVVVSQDKPKVEKMAMNPIENSGRKTLADLSNRLRTTSTFTRDNKSLSNSLTVKDYIEQLQKENAALMKLLADKNRIIDISGAELQKLRTTLQKMQQQNLLLAQSNSQLLADLNSGKDRLKDLQHQLGCRNGLFIAKKLELEGKRKTKTCETTNQIKKVKVSEHEESEVCKVAEREDHHSNTNGRQKSKSLGPSAEKVQEKGVGDSGRLQDRRQSARFKHDEPKPVENLCHTTDEMDDKMQEDNVAFFVKKDENTSRRSSISRPSREVAKKVQSYREPSLNMKMRRPE